MSTTAINLCLARMMTHQRAEIILRETIRHGVLVPIIHEGKKIGELTDGGPADSTFLGLDGWLFAMNVWSIMTTFSGDIAALRRWSRNGNRTAQMVLADYNSRIKEVILYDLFTQDCLHPNPAFRECYDCLTHVKLSKVPMVVNNCLKVLGPVMHGWSLSVREYRIYRKPEQSPDDDQWLVEVRWFNNDDTLICCESEKWAKKWMRLHALENMTAMIAARDMDYTNTCRIDNATRTLHT